MKNFRSWKNSFSLFFFFISIQFFLLEKKGKREKFYFFEWNRNGKIALELFDKGLNWTALFKYKSQWDTCFFKSLSHSSFIYGFENGKLVENWLILGDSCDEFLSVLFLFHSQDESGPT